MMNRSDMGSLFVSIPVYIIHSILSSSNDELTHSICLLYRTLRGIVGDVENLSNSMARKTILATQKVVLPGMTWRSIGTCCN